MRKALFKVSNGKVFCGPDYMREKLSASNSIDQNLALEQIKDALINGSAMTGIIDQKVRDRAGVQILTGDFQDLGEIIFADNCCHPAIRNLTCGNNIIHGVGAFP